MWHKNEKPRQCGAESCLSGKNSEEFDGSLSHSRASPGNEWAVVDQLTSGEDSPPGASVAYWAMGSPPDPTDRTALRQLCADLREIYIELADMLRAEGPFMSHDAAQKFDAKEAAAKAIRAQIEMIAARWPLND